MSLGNGEMSAADIAAVTGNNNFGFGDGSFWIIILFLFAFMGNGWGGNGNVQADMQRGFDQTATMAAINGVNNSVIGGFASAEVANCDRLANLTAQINGLALGLQSTASENRAAVADLKYTVATENCSDRTALQQGIRDIIENQNAKAQMIMDKMCQQEIDALKAQNANLQTQLNLVNLAASQNAQTATLIQDNNAQTANLLQRLNPTPVPAYVVPQPGCGSPCPCGTFA